jgi:hypothetical protein
MPASTATFLGATPGLTTFRVWQCDNLPNVEVRWYGGCTFSIFLTSPTEQYEEVDCFTHYGPNGQAPSAEEADHAVRSYFLRLVMED